MFSVDKNMLLVFYSVYGQFVNCVCERNQKTRKKIHPPLKGKFFYPFWRDFYIFKEKTCFDVSWNHVLDILLSSWGSHCRKILVLVTWFLVFFFFARKIIFWQLWNHVVVNRKRKTNDFFTMLPDLFFWIIEYMFFFL